jgi:hypothetical protein
LVAAARENDPVSAGPPSADDELDEDDTPRRGWVRRFTTEEMRRFDEIGRRSAHPRQLLDAVWDLVLTDIEGFGVADARRRGFTIDPNRYAIAADQWNELFDLVRGTSTGNPAVDLDHDDLWIAQAPNTYR